MVTHSRLVHSQPQRFFFGNYNKFLSLHREWQKCRHRKFDCRHSVSGACIHKGNSLWHSSIFSSSSVLLQLSEAYMRQQNFIRLTSQSVMKNSDTNAIFQAKARENWRANLLKSTTEKISVVQTEGDRDVNRRQKTRCSGKRHQSFQSEIYFMKGKEKSPYICKTIVESRKAIIEKSQGVRIPAEYLFFFRSPGHLG